ncbi:MAG TPA: lysylphosphatidylglycerol synthase transmembrane domain-containing protein [Acidobacteriaceae bacterium]|nr:lysylphosphatidylglycerol synthase transmembrane domain-containing protein [Acidobacteriaceae bacterium]
MPKPDGVRVSEETRRGVGNRLLKTVPGLLISAFFLWRTFFPHGHPAISRVQLHSLRVVAPGWIFAVLVFSVASYTMRSLRWKRMMRPAGTSFRTCARVLMTSLAANNILPLRIGDIMRVFTYAPELGASPSFILSTVILEKLLDIFVLAVLFIATMASTVSPRLRLAANAAVGISALCILVLLLGARALAEPLSKLFARLPKQKVLVKLEHWILLALDCIRQIGLMGTVFLLGETLLVWTCEGIIYLSAMKLIGLVANPLGPWNCVAFVNLSFLIPSSPGGIGPFEAAAQKSLATHGAHPGAAALFGLALHVWMLITITGIGGAWFLYHRYRAGQHESLLTEIETLPELPG